MSKRNVTLASILACIVLPAISIGRWPQAASQPPGIHTAARGGFVPVVGISQPTQSTESILDEVIARYSPDRVSWLEVELWQRMIDHAGVFEANGRLLRGPYHTVNLNLRIRREKRTSTVQCVSDGRHFFKSVCVKGGNSVNEEKELPNEASHKDLNQLLARRESFLQKVGCAGPVGLLRAIRGELKSTWVETGLWQGKQVYRISGNCRPAAPKPGKKSKITFAPPHLPRLGCVFLDTKTLWPYRVEWWDSATGTNRILVLEIEFRNPRINHPVPQHRWEDEFAIPRHKELNSVQ